MKNIFYILVLFSAFGCVNPSVNKRPSPLPSYINLSKSPETLNDLKVYRSKKKLDAFSYAWEELPKERQIKLAYHLLNDKNGLTVYRGTQLLIKNGREKDCFPALAGLIAEGKDKTELKGRMGWDWLHSEDETLMPRMMEGILTFMNENYSSYSPDEKKNILYFFKSIGYNGDYDKQRIQKLIDSVTKKMLNQSKKHKN